MGSFVNKNLVPSETVFHETRYHWIIFISLRGLLTLFIWPFIIYKTSEFVITNKRVIIKTGFISRHTIEMKLSQIESVTINQSIIGRIFGFGSMSLIGSGSTREVFYRISKPITFRTKVNDST